MIGRIVSEPFLQESTDLRPVLRVDPVQEGEAVFPRPARRRVVALHVIEQEHERIFSDRGRVGGGAA
jgi:hypothetical protein